MPINHGTTSISAVNHGTTSATTVKHGTVTVFEVSSGYTVTVEIGSGDIYDPVKIYDGQSASGTLLYTSETTLPETVQVTITSGYIYVTGKNGNGSCNYLSFNYMMRVKMVMV